MPIKQKEHINGQLSVLSGHDRRIVAVQELLKSMTMKSLGSVHARYREIKNGSVLEINGDYGKVLDIKVIVKDDCEFDVFKTMDEDLRKMDVLKFADGYVLCQELVDVVELVPSIIGSARLIVEDNRYQHMYENADLGQSWEDRWSGAVSQ